MVVAEHVMFLMRAISFGLIDRVPRAVREAQAIIAVQQKEERREFRRLASGLPVNYFVFWNVLMSSFTCCTRYLVLFILFPSFLPLLLLYRLFTAVAAFNVFPLLPPFYRCYRIFTAVIVFYRCYCCRRCTVFYRSYRCCRLFTDVAVSLPLLSLLPSCYCLLYTSPSPRDQRGSRMPSSA